MGIRSRENSLGAWAFLIGVVLAVIIGLSATLIPIPAIAKYSSQIYGVLVVLGVVVGFINVNSKDSEKFMIAGAILVIVSRYGMDAVKGSLIGIGVGDVSTAVFSALLALFVPATIIVALKAVFNIARV